MADMLAYSIQMLREVAYVLGEEPLIYLLGLVCLAATVKIMKTLVGVR